ncbi:helix-turn-helix domain-containing protein [Pseudooceanicola nanhaiensis]|uniref:helix-turn-helix domain-containing protein n=1 Tax=Pseudooceanicola nanhaiensis TaxID=375761 RepID=UPI0035120980
MMIDPKSRKSARFISGLQRKIQKALSESGKTQQEIANILDIDRSVVNRRLKGGANLTARSIAELAFALDKDIEIEFVSTSRPKPCNWTQTTGEVVSIDSVDRDRTQGTVAPNAQYVLERTGS